MPGWVCVEARIHVYCIKIMITKDAIKIGHLKPSNADMSQVHFKLRKTVSRREYAHTADFSLKNLEEIDASPSGKRLDD